MQPEIALAVSPRSWSHELDQFVADHGGARVRTRVMSPTDAMEESYDVLIIDDVTSFVSRRLLDRIRVSGRRVLGVFDPTEAPEGKERLVDLGVDDVIEADASPDEFLIAVRALAIGRSEPDHREETPLPAPQTGRLIAVAGAAGGVGATEVSIVLASGLARYGPGLLVDGDDQSPAVAQRLGLGLHPSLRTALDYHHHGTADQSDALQRLPGRPLSVLTGIATRADWFELRPSEVVDLITTYAEQFDFVVVNSGPSIETQGYTTGPVRTGLARALLAAADECIVVADASPVGLTRLLEWVAEAAGLTGRLRAVLNRAPRSPYRRAEIGRELARVGVVSDPVFAPLDPRVEEAAWEGSTPGRGPFVRSLRPLVRVLAAA